MRIRRVLSALLLAAYLPACTSYQATSQPLAQLTAQPKPVEQVRITTIEGAQFEVGSPRVANDTLYGSTWAQGSGSKPSQEAVAVPVASLRTVEVRRPDATKRAMVIGGIVVAFALLAVVGVAEVSTEVVDLGGF